MNIIQTLWNSNKSLLKETYNWLSPQHHLMGWALSSLKIREFYEDLHLYTDRQGKEILIDKLGLPYSKVISSYDDLAINSAQWALPKILTYSCQESPFIHIDGDVFIWKRFSKEIEQADIIAQNVEKGTAYYSSLMKNLTTTLDYVPDWLKKELLKKSTPSFNAGILGGSDISFFKYYTQEALKLIEKNTNSQDINFNILFEQILLFFLAKEKGIKVNCQFNKKYNDNGYTIHDIGDFTRTRLDKTYLHLVGANKRNNYACRFMTRALFNEYPEYFYRVADLFKEKHIHYIKFCDTDKKKTNINNLLLKKTDRYMRTISFIQYVESDKKITTIASIRKYVKQSDCITLKSLFKYETNIYNLVLKWAKIEQRVFLSLEKHPAYVSVFLTASKKERGKIIIKRNPFLSIINTSHDWTTFRLPTRKEQTNFSKKRCDIACMPELFFGGYSEVAIDNLEYNVLLLLGSPMQFKDLLNEVSSCFTDEERRNNKGNIYKLISLKVKNLIDHKCIYIKSDS